MLYLSRLFYVLAIIFSIFFHTLKRYAVIGWVLVLLVTGIAVASGAEPYRALFYSAGAGVLFVFVGSVRAIFKPW